MVKKARKKVVLVGGCFDLLHYGHYTFLKKAKEQGNYLIVAVESDNFIMKHKKRKPIHSQRERAEILSGIKYVDKVILMPYLSSDSEYAMFVKKIKPDIIAVTQGDPKIEKKKNQVHGVGGELKIVTPLLGDFSTKKIIDSLL